MYAVSIMGAGLSLQFVVENQDGVGWDEEPT